MQRDLAAILDGAVGGTVGTAAMSVGMLAAKKSGLMGAQPPELITAAALDASGMHNRSRGTQDALSLATHFGFGIASGALFAVLHRRLRLPIPPILHGVVFATLVWLVSYKGWVPALHIMPPPEHDRPGRPTAMVLAHWIFGSVLAIVVERGIVASRYGR